VEEFEDGLKKNKNILVYFEKKKKRRNAIITLSNTL
jgi:hypothetical protein